MNKHFRVSGRSFQKLEELGVRVSAVLRRAGLPAALFDQPRVLVTTEELFAFWRAIGEVSTESRHRPVDRHGSKDRALQPHWLSPRSQRKPSARPWTRWRDTSSSPARRRSSSRPTTKSGASSSAGFSLTKLEPPVLIECCLRLAALDRSPRHRYSPLAAALGVHASLARI